MDVSDRQLRAAHRSAERERDDVERIRQKIQRRIHDRSDQVMELSKDVSSLSRRALKTRNRKDLSLFHRYLNQINEKKEQKQKVSKETASLLKSAELLGKEAAVQTEKVERLEEAIVQKEFGERVFREEVEYEELSDQYRLRQLDREQIEVPKKDEQVFSDGQKQHVQSDSQGSEMAQHQSNPQFSPPLDEQSQQEEQPRSFHQVMEDIEERPQQKQQLTFSVPVSEDMKAAVTIVRNRERELTLSVKIDNGECRPQTLRALKVRLGQLLQRSGYLLHHLEVRS